MYFSIVYLLYTFSHSKYHHLNVAFFLTYPICISKLNESTNEAYSLQFYFLIILTFAKHRERIYGVRYNKIDKL